MTNIRIGRAGRRRLVAGAQLAARVVGATLGPGGRTVLAERSWAMPYATKDGVTVAREVAIEDRHAHMGAMFALEASRKTVSAVGDGTTATVVLVGEMTRAGELLRAAGYGPMALARGMRRAADEVTSALREMSRPVDTTEDIRRVALLAGNGDEAIASAIASSLEAAGLHGIVSIAKSKKTKLVEVDVSSGLWFDRGWGSGSGASMLRPDEMADGGGTIRISRPLVLLLDDPMGDARGLVSLLEAALRVIKAETLSPHGGLLVIGRVTGDARSTLVRNRLAGQLDAVAVDPPWVGGASASTNGTSTTLALDDIAVATGASVLGARLGRPALHAMSDSAVEVGMSTLGHAAHVEVRSNKTLIELLPLGLHGEDLDAGVMRRLGEIEAARDRALSLGQAHTADGLSVRASRLGGGTVTLCVGGWTETEAVERAFRVEDALCATRSAVRGGVVPGGGAALALAAVRLAEKPVLPQGLDLDEAAGRMLVLRACHIPLRLLVHNAGDDGLLVGRRLMLEPSGSTWDAREHKFVDAWTSGILDPCDVVSNEVRNAVSAAAALMEVEVSLHPLRERG